MYGFAVEDCLYHPTSEKCFYRRYGKHRESEDVSPHKLCLQKIAFELWLGFENLEMYTFQALWERFKRVVIVCTDRDVLVLLIASFQSL